MDNKVVLNYTSFPEIIESGYIKLDEDKMIKLSVDKENNSDIDITIIDNTFGAGYLNTFALSYETAKDFYNILYRLLKQSESKGGMKNGSN